FIQVQAMIEGPSTGGADGPQSGAYIIGVDPELESNVTQLARNLTATEGRVYGMGTLPGDKEIVLGFQLANTLGVGLGDKVWVHTLLNKRKPNPWSAAAG